MIATSTLEYYAPYGATVDAVYELGSIPPDLSAEEAGAIARLITDADAACAVWGWAQPIGLMRRALVATC